MRILQLSNKPPYPPDDGSSIAMCNMSLGFIANKVDLTLLTINTKKHFKPDSGVDEAFKKQSNYRSVYRNTDVTAQGALLNLFSGQSYMVSRFYFKEFEEKLIALLKEKDFDIVHLESIFMGNYIPVIRKHSKAGISIRTHNIEHLIWQRMIENERSWIKKKYLLLQNKRLKDFEYKTLQSADAIVPITAVDEAYFRNWGINKPYCSSPTGLVFSKYPVNNQNERPLSVFHFGSMDWLPNEEAVLWFVENVWEKVLQKVPQAKFYIIGRGMTAKVSLLQKPHVVVVGKTESAEKVYQDHAVMVVPLLSGSGMRIKMIEGMAYAKPIVSTSIGAEGIAVTSGKNCLLADTPDDFANAVVEILTSKEKKELLSKEARAFTEQFYDNTAIVKKLTDFYQTLL
ncbi:MAG TPA: glycosyltransferase family 4 protein [Bacteroidia bacterium]|jgi:glycosyltransferase involved in cell wall biosynthesis|nr:glycosyltransferase family 4 protein [Bacteroidia bacterium]